MSTNVFNTTMDQNNEEKNRFKFTVKTKYSPGIIVRHTTDNTTSKMNRSIMANVISTSDIST